MISLFKVVNFQYDNGATVAFNMVAFTKRVCAREVCIYGTKGQISYDDGWEDVQVFDFLEQNTSKQIHLNHLKINIKRRS